MTQNILRKKYFRIIVLLIVLCIALIINLNSSKPLFKILMVNKTFHTVLLNNHSLSETLELAKKVIVEKQDYKYGYLVYQELLKENPENIDAYTGFALIYGYLGNYQEAEKYIKIAESKIKPSTSPESLIDLYYTAGSIYKSSFVYEGNKNRNNTIDYFNKALKINGLTQIWKDSYDYSIYLNLGDLYSSMKNTEENNQKALDYFFRALEKNSSDKSLYYSIALTYIALEDLDKAYEYLNYYKNEFGENSSYLLALSNYYTISGDLDYALSSLKKAENILPIDDLYKLNYFYGKYYEKNGETKKAKESFRKAIEANNSLIFEEHFQDTLNKFNMDFSDIEEKIKKEKEENYNRRINL